MFVSSPVQRSHTFSDVPVSGWGICTMTIPNVSSWSVHLLTHSHNFFTTIQFGYICLLWCYKMKVSWVTSVVPRGWIVGFVLKRKKELCILECPSISFLKIYFCKFDLTCMYLLALLCAGNSSGQHRASCDCLPLHPSSVPSRWDMSRGRHQSATSNGR